MYLNFDEIDKSESLVADTYDVIYANDTFLHSHDKAKLASEVSKLLRKDGLLVFTDILE